MTEDGRARRLGLAWAVSFLAGLGLLLSLLGSGCVPAADAGVQRFEQAWGHRQAVRGDPPPAEAADLGLSPLQDLPAPDQLAAWLALSLPDHVSAPAASTDPGPEPVSVWWYRVAYTVPAGVEGPLALYVPRLGGGAAQVAEHDGRAWRLRWDGTDHWREQWNRPIMVDLGRAPPAGQTLQLAVGLIRHDFGAHRVAQISVGPREGLAFRDGWRRALQLTAPQVVSMTFLALGLFSFMFWARRREEQAYLLFSFSSLVWTLRSLHYYIEFPRDESTYVWFWWATNAALSWVMMLIYMFAFRFDARSYPRVERALVVFVLVMSAITMPLPWQLPWPSASPLLLQHLCNSLVAMGVTSFLTVLAWRGGGREFRVIVGALWVCQIFGAHDLLLVSGWVGPGSIYLLPFATVLIMLSFLYAVQRRYALAIDQVEQANQHLGQRLAEREAELQANHERLRGIEREQALLLERQRLMRDMHDGLGSTLMSSLVLVEQGRLDAPAVALLLRECVDDLRLVIDSLEPIGHDLVTLLASLRHRLGRRLEAAGLGMRWEVEDLPPLDWLHPPDALQVLRIVQEVLTNVLKHASACTVRIATRHQGDEVQVLIEDDGCGFDPEAVSAGRGLRHLSQRATRLGGRLVLHSAPGQGTRVQLDLPLQRGASA